MRNGSRSLVIISIALAFAAGIAGSGCKRARHVDSSTATATTPGVFSGSNEITASLEKSAAKNVSPSDLARKELGSAGETAQAPVTATSTATTTTTTNPHAPAQAPRAPEPMCYIEVFHHKPTPGHTDEEACSHHKNLMTLAHAEINPAHICVRVNGIPVKFDHKADRKGDQILIGAIAGPKAQISVSYCVGKLTCAAVAQKDCTIPKDEFMDALGDDAAAGDDVPAAQWEGTDSKLNADVKKELSNMDGMDSPDSVGANARGPASLSIFKGSIFKGWIEDQDAPACPKQAS